MSLPANNLREAGALLTAEDVAAMLAVPVTWVRETTRAGHLPCVRLGRYVRYDRIDVLSWLDSCREGGGPRFRRYSPAPHGEGR